MIILNLQQNSDCIRGNNLSSVDILNTILVSQNPESGGECHSIAEKQRLSGLLIVSFAQSRLIQGNRYSMYLWGSLLGESPPLQFLHFAPGLTDLSADLNGISFVRMKALSKFLSTS